MRQTMKYLTSGLAGLMAAGALSSAQAATPASGTQHGSSTASSSQGSASAGERETAGHGKTWLMGNVIAVKKNRLAVNTENGRMRSLALTRNTAIVIDGKRAKAGDLKPGAFVMASYEGSGAHATAIRVQVDESRRAMK